MTPRPNGGTAPDLAALNALAADQETPPATVEEAVLRAMEDCQGTLVFGAAVNWGESIGTLSADAGPPEKVLRYLRALGEYTEAKRSNSLGTTAVKWLEEKNVAAAPESDTIRNNSKERAARTWDDGTGDGRYFDMHLKPKEATSPDQCVRICFDYDAEIGKTVVGWVGAHP